MDILLYYIRNNPYTEFQEDEGMVERDRSIKVGDMAPDFTLKDQNGKDFALTGQKGKRVVLSFHPLAWTEVCSKQMQSLENNYSIFEASRTIPIGLSVDAVPSKRRGPSTLE